MYWNVNGRLLFLNTNFIRNWLCENFDICFITETHMTKGELFTLDAFVSFHNAYSKPPCEHPRGGISCLIQKTFMQNIIDVNSSIENFIVLTLKGNHTLFGAYITPRDSIYFDETCFADLSNVFVPLDSDYAVIGGGDINSRVGDIKLVPPLAQAKYRLNPDKDVNANGNLLKKICKNFQCYVVNNLSVLGKHFDGKFTFNKGGRKSQVDLCITNLAALRNVDAFDIIEIGWNPSDHSPICVKFKLPVSDNNTAPIASEDLNTTAGTIPIKRPQKISSSLVNWGSYSAILNREIPNIINKAPAEITEEAFNTIIMQISSKMYNTAKFCQQDQDDPLQNSVQCTEEELRLINSANYVYQSYVRGEMSHDDWITSRNQTNQLLMQNYSKNEMEKWKFVIDNNDARALWQKINWKGEINQGVSSEQSPSPDALARHFKSKSSNEGVDDVSFPVAPDNYVHDLDKPITSAEVENECKRLKSTKSTFDGWSPYMITTISGMMFPILTFVFNFILLHHIFPTEWILTLIKAIFKNKGSRQLAKFYRPVSLVCMLSKLLDFVLLTRFKNWFHPSDEQSAYQAGRSCADNIFLLRCLINFAKKNKQKLFLIAVDFDGAFDRVNRSQLFRKLITFGAGTTYVSCLMAIYRRTDYIIFGNDDYASYEAMAGIKQGSPLSPMLFLFYVDDIFQFFIATFCSYFIYETVHILMHADDAVLIASSRVLSVLKLKHLLKYCAINSIKLETSKSHFIVINGGSEDCVPLPTSCGDISNCDHLSLLGSHLSASGAISDDLKLHYESRFKACIKFYNFLKANKLPRCLSS